MAREWWWPWWISTAIDVVLALGALIVLVRARRQHVRLIAALVVCGAVFAAGLAPLVMKEPAGEKPSMFRKDGEAAKVRTSETKGNSQASP